MKIKQIGLTIELLEVKLDDRAVVCQFHRSSDGWSVLLYAPEDMRAAHAIGHGEDLATAVTEAFGVWDGDGEVKG